MTRIVYNLVIRIRNLVLGFVPIVFAAVFAAVNTATDRSPKGYAFAAVTALATVFVSPAFQKAELRAKVVPPTVAEIVAVQVEAALRAHEQSVAALATVTEQVPAPLDPAAPVSA